MSVVVSYVDESPTPFAPDQNTPNGVYANTGNRAVIVAGVTGSKQTIELGLDGAIIEKAVGDFVGTIRELDCSDLFLIKGT